MAQVKSHMKSLCSYKTPQNLARMTRYGFKYVSNSLRARIQLYMCHTTLYSLSVLQTLIHKSASYLLLPEQVEAMIFSLNVSRFSGGVYGYQAVISFLPQVPTVDRGAPPR